MRTGVALVTDALRSDSGFCAPAALTGRTGPAPTVTFDLMPRLQSAMLQRWLDGRGIVYGPDLFSIGRSLGAALRTAEPTEE